MTRSTLIIGMLATALVAGACSDNNTTTGQTPNSPTSPSGPATSPTTVVLTAQLAASNEVPPITNADANGTGTATITIHAVRDAGGAITSGSTVDFAVTLSAFPPGTVLTAAHIHPGVVGANGGIAVGAGLASGEVTLADGSGSFTKTGQSINAADATAIIANPSAYYFNVHTQLNPGGASRGQLAVTSTTSLPY
jgi:hypothetical protein